MEKEILREIEENVFQFNTEKGIDNTTKRMKKLMKSI